jgi:hypothetical protein
LQGARGLTRCRVGGSGSIRNTSAMAEDEDHDRGGI